jgi:hypothetical protein
LSAGPRRSNAFRPKDCAIVVFDRDEGEVGIFDSRSIVCCVKSWNIA